MRHALMTLMVAIALAAGVCSADVVRSNVWQPQLALEREYLDSRLDRRITVEIIGRPVGPALKQLSELSAVSLSLDPRKLTTLGERKVTIIARNLPLRTIMVQLPVALPECYWVMTGQGDTAGYTLCWDVADYYSHSYERSLRKTAEQQEASARARGTRVEEAIGALQLSDEQLDRLESKDPLLALAARCPTTRLGVQALLSLPPVDIENFIQQGEVEVSWQSAPEALREAARAVIEDLVMRAKAQRQDSATAITESGATSSPEELEQEIHAGEELLESLPRTTLRFKDAGCDRGLGIILDINRNGKTVIPPRQTSTKRQLQRLTAQLTSTGSAGADTGDTWLEMQRASSSAGETASRQEHSEPRLAELKRIIRFPDVRSLALADVQIRISRQTDFSIVSDYYTMPAAPLPDVLRQGLPVWRALDLLARDGGYEWQGYSTCVVFHRTDWYDMTLKEVPEALLSRYRRKLTEQGGVTLDDVASLYRALRNTVPIAMFSFPNDLREAGLAVHPRDQWALLVYSSLSPSQRERASSTAGLQSSEMTKSQVDLLSEEVGRTTRGEVASLRVQKEASHSAGAEGRSKGHKIEYSFVLSCSSGQVIRASIAIASPASS